MWVKETFIPRSLRTLLSALRLASRVSTAIVRNEVAVGTSRLSSIALASIAAGPRKAFASPDAAGRPAQRRYRPRQPQRARPPWSPSSPARCPRPRQVRLRAPRATRRATGVALTSWRIAVGVGPAGLFRRLLCGWRGSRGRERRRSPRPQAPRTPRQAPQQSRSEPSAESPSRRVPSPPDGAPTGTSSSTDATSLVITPAVGAGTSASTLSVETSTTVSPSLTKSPSATCHSSTMPSVTDSPISGIWISTVAVCAIRRLSV